MKVIPKSRYDSIDSFLSNCCNKWDGYNDIEVYHGDDDADGEDDDNELRFTSEDCPSRTIDHSDEKVLYDPEIYKQLLEGGVDQLMAQHVAHLFIRCRHHHYHLVNFFFKMTPQRHYFLVDGASKEIFIAQGFREHVHQQSEEGWRL